MQYLRFFTKKTFSTISPKHREIHTMNKTIIAAIVGSLLLGAQINSTLAQDSIKLTTMGSFAFGGTVTQLSDGTTFHGDHGYAQYYIAENSRHLPIVMWHVIGQSGKTYESAPDGREGFQALLPREDWSVYIVDQPRRGRAGYTLAEREESNISTIISEAGVWEAFRNGPWTPGQKAKIFNNSQFPLSPESVEQFFRQQTPDTGKEPMTAEYRHFIGDTGAKLFEAIGEGILITHSNSGQYGWEIAMHAPDKVKAIIAFEPGASAFPQDNPPEDFAIAQDLVKKIQAPRLVEKEHWQNLTKMPILIIYGDNIEKEPNANSFNAEIWRVAKKRAQQMTDMINAAGGDATLYSLPDHGIYGNTHAPFADKNNKEILKIVTDFLAYKGLNGYDKPHVGPTLPAPDSFTLPLDTKRADSWHD